MKQAVEHLRAADPKLAAWIEQVGPCQIAFHPPEFSTLARSIVFQQLSGKAAATIYGRLEQAVGPGGVRPESILSIEPEQMRPLGLSGQKAKYLRSLAEKTVDGTINFAQLPSMPDEEVIAHLTSAKGVGVWTAQMFLMFALQRPDVLPLGDLGIRNAMQRLYRLRTPPLPERMTKIARPWRPYATYACWYLWRGLDGAANL
ncbi:DNA-3-methyladenine glycosylase family protein [Paludibaculum fermentans]|uniref:DNA-3-methyladenine glycosylase II n=1 Tax=Paludibaculum fermentans TaxID=1473598 RepID=A0A7S7NRV2_PALFE|nr:DNA-3-methyladenine glycosylase [Paludibaculum fermentans]QOY88556.1 DNA-3-methyladenine glycosylase 2 family protein [Paludibaculum fermentans]